MPQSHLAAARASVTRIVECDVFTENHEVTAKKLEGTIGAVGYHNLQEK
jgi:hypothetical protein